MKKIRPVAMTLVMVMLMTLLSSCAHANTSDNVVKEDDPWYKTTTFMLSEDLGQNNYLGTSSGLCSSNDNVFNMYCYSIDRGGSYRTVLDTYDLEGNMVNRKDITCTDDYRLVRILSINSDAEGKKMNSVLYMRSDNGFDVCFAEIDISSGMVSDIRKLIDDDIEKVIKPHAGFMYIVESGDYSIAAYDTSDPGSLYTAYQLRLFKDHKFVTELDLTTVSIRYFFGGCPIDEKANSLYMAGFEGTETVCLEFDIRNGSLKNKKTFNEISDDAVNLAEYSETDNGELCKIDSFGNIVKINMSTMTPETVIDSSAYNPYFYPLSTDEHTVNSGIVSCNEDRTIIIETEIYSYGILDSSQSSRIMVLTKEEKNPNAGKKVIELALPPNSGVSDYLAKSVYEFNISDSEYYIKVWSKYNSGFNLSMVFGNADENDQKVFEMIRDLKGDEAPDIAIGIQKNYAMRDDVFMDLTGFLDQEVIDKQYGNIIEACRINGKLYFLPVTIEIEGLVTNEELLEDGAVGITFEEYDKLINEDMKGFSPYDYPYSKYYNRNSFILSCIDTKSAIDGEKVDFGTDQFRTAIEYAKDKFKYEDEASMPIDYIYDFNRNRGECYYSRMNDYLDFVHACCKSKYQYRIIGTPSVDASGPRFKALETISVSATTDVKDGCRRFMNYLFAGTAFSFGEYEYWQIVTNKDIMEKAIDTMTDFNNKKFEKFAEEKNLGLIANTSGAEKAYGDKMATEGMRESFLNSMSSISTYYYEDRSIIQFVDEELAPYYAGDRTIDDAIILINDRVSKYIREM